MTTKELNAKKYELQALLDKASELLNEMKDETRRQERKCKKSWEKAISDLEPEVVTDTHLENYITCRQNYSALNIIHKIVDTAYFQLREVSSIIAEQEK